MVLAGANSGLPVELNEAHRSQTEGRLIEVRLRDCFRTVRPIESCDSADTPPPARGIPARASAFRWNKRADASQRETHRDPPAAGHTTRHPPREQTREPTSRLLVERATVNQGCNSPIRSEQIAGENQSQRADRRISLVSKALVKKQRRPISRDSPITGRM